MMLKNWGLLTWRIILHKNNRIMERVKDDRGGTVMTVDRLYRHLLQKLINANIDIDAYLQLRKAKGYMSVSENDHLRDNLFELCREMRAQAPRLQNAISPEERDVLRLAGESVAAAALCLMSGHHDCPLYIAVNVEKLERCLTGLTSNIHKLNKLALITHA